MENRHFFLTFIIINQQYIWKGVSFVKQVQPSPTCIHNACSPTHKACQTFAYISQDNNSASLEAVCSIAEQLSLLRIFLSIFYQRQSCPQKQWRTIFSCRHKLGIFIEGITTSTKSISEKAYQFPAFNKMVIHMYCQA